MLEPTAPLKRLLPPTGPLLLIRDVTAHGATEGLMLKTFACENLDCTCREVGVTGWLAPERLLQGLSTEGAPADMAIQTDKPEAVLWAAVDIDAGSVTVEEGAPESKAWAMEWLKSELDAELLAVFRARFEEAKRPRDWRTEDWSWWKPGDDVGWIDVHPGRGRVELEFEGHVYLLTDLYCVDPSCDCVDVRVFVERERDDGPPEPVGNVYVEAQSSSVMEFEPDLDGADGGKRDAELRRVWAAFVEHHTLEPSFAARRAEVRGLAKEIHSRFGAQNTVRRTAPKVGRNDPCPCGSGLKYKKCCIDKA